MYVQLRDPEWAVSGRVKMTELIAGDCDKTRAKIGFGTSGGGCVTFG